jgi:cytidylate kinase
MAGPTASPDPATPLHGYRGEERQVLKFPRTLTITISRQTGARGLSIGKRVGRKLGWQVIDHEVMDMIARRGGAEDELSAAARAWADERLAELRQAGSLSDDLDAESVARTILHYGALGEVVLVGRGAGHLLPPASTLSVRIIAPRADRVAYMQQWLRLSPAEAESEVADRDRRRSQFLLDNLSVNNADPTSFDLVLNSSRLGEELAAEIIVQAARAKLMGGDDESE